MSHHSTEHSQDSGRELVDLGSKIDELKNDGSAVRTLRLIMNDSIEGIKPWTKNQSLNVVIETPKGSRVKYAYDFKSGFFVLSKALPEGMVFPFNFGFVPQTLAEDGEPILQPPVRRWRRAHRMPTCDWL